MINVSDFCMKKKQERTQYTGVFFKMKMKIRKELCSLHYIFCQRQTQVALADKIKQIITLSNNCYKYICAYVT